MAVTQDETIHMETPVFSYSHWSEKRPNFYVKYNNYDYAIVRSSERILSVTIPKKGIVNDYTLSSKRSTCGISQYGLPTIVALEDLIIDDEDYFIDEDED